MRCIRQGLPRAGVESESQVSVALTSCVTASSLEAVTVLVRLGSCIQRLSSEEQEVPYTCGEEMMELITAVGGDLEDTMELSDHCPLPMQKGGAINVTVETAGEVLKLARDSLEAASLQAMKLCETEESTLLTLPQRFPLQAVLVAMRVQFARLVDDALAASTSLSELREAVLASQVSVAEHLKKELSSRECIAFGEVQTLLQERQQVVDLLIAAENPAEAAALWEREMRFYLSAEKTTLRCCCAGKTLPVGFEYNPRTVLPASECCRRFRLAFVETFGSAVSRRERPPALLICGPDAAGKTNLVQDTCSMLGGAPVVVKASEARESDTFWSRAIIATRASSGGSPLAVLIVEDAHLAQRNVLEAADMASREQPVLMCYTVNPEASMVFKLEDAMRSTLVRFEATSL